MNKTILSILLLTSVYIKTIGQALVKDSTYIQSSSLKLLSKGVNIGYRAGIDTKNNELLAGYFFNLVDQKHHKLITFDNDLFANLNYIGFNSTISYSNHLLSLSYSTDVFKSQGHLNIIPAIGLSAGYNDLFSLGLFYNYKFNSEIIYPTFAFKVMIRPSFINVLSQNADGSKW